MPLKSVARSGSRNGKGAPDSVAVVVVFGRPPSVSTRPVDGMFSVFVWNAEPTAAPPAKIRLLSLGLPGAPAS